MAAMIILIAILIQSYNLPCNNIKTVICIYLTKFLLLLKDKQRYHSEINPVGVDRIFNCLSYQHTYNLKAV